MVHAAVLAVLAGLIASVSASAIPVVSVDADPATSGIQAFAAVPGGVAFDIDVVVTGVEASAPLNAFEFDLMFNSLILDALSVADGGFLLDPVFILQEEVGMVSVEFAEATLAPVGASGDGVLAKITFDPISLGTSDLDLENVLLSEPFGIPIPAGTPEDGEILVTPEPSTASLVGLGVLALSFAGARRRSCQRVA